VSDSGRSARSLRGAREHKNCLRAELGEQAIVVQRLAAHQRHTEEIKLRTAELSVKALVDALFSQCQRQMIRWQLLPIYHVRKAREFRRSFLLATTVFQNKSLILDSTGGGERVRSASLSDEGRVPHTVQTTILGGGSHEHGRPNPAL
jgi:hypothetical protein